MYSTIERTIKNGNMELCPLCFARKTVTYPSKRETLVLEYECGTSVEQKSKRDRTLLKAGDSCSKIKIPEVFRIN